MHYISQITIHTMHILSIRNNENVAPGWWKGLRLQCKKVCLSWAYFWLVPLVYHNTAIILNATCPGVALHALSAFTWPFLSRFPPLESLCVHVLISTFYKDPGRLIYTHLKDLVYAWVLFLFQVFLSLVYFVIH